MQYVGYYFIELFVIFVAMYIGSFILRKKHNKLGGSAGFKYIEKKYDLNMDKLSPKFVANIFGLGNGLHRIKNKLLALWEERIGIGTRRGTMKSIPLFERG